EKRPEVEAVLAPLDDKAVYLGAMTPDALPGWYKHADLYVWPACGEAYGMAFLEAEGCGLPVVAGNIRGVPDVVMNNKTGLLTPPEDAVAFAGAIDRLLADAPLREKMARAGQRFVRTERTLPKAAEILKTHIGRAL
ncbi:glycosyltransferase family 4 protein, partial [Sneathiella sp.]|uniref:glycosyltransferase family 4 protein n=1 Tax=Sneathiella sp. TaxID=1964365 RepID=UPI00260DB0A7